MFKDRIAVHFNFQAQKLSLRAIHPITGTLTKLIDIRDSALLTDCEFTFNKARWLDWREGRNPKVRQFAEIRGALINIPNAAEIKNIAQDWERVNYNPRLRPDFYLDGEERVENAPNVYIAGKDIFIPNRKMSHNDMAH